MKGLTYFITVLTVYVVSLFAQSEGETKIMLAHASAKSYFGKSVDIAGRRAIIGSNNGAHIYEFSGASWQHVATLREDDKGQSLYGFNVAIDGDYAIVGGEQGYVYRYNGQGWGQMAQLRAGEKNTLVALSGEWAITGGATEIAFFRRVSESWQEKAKFDPDGHSIGVKALQTSIGFLLKGAKGAKASKSKSMHDFNAVAISGRHAIAGVPKDSDKAEQSGAVYFYALKGSDGWEKVKRIKPPDPVKFGYFGSTVDISGDYAIVGAEGNVAAYIFKFDGKEWRLQKKLQVDDADRNDRFGNAVTIDDDFAIVGAMEDNDWHEKAGAIYVFRKAGDDWIKQDKLYTSDIAADDGLGWAVSLSGHTVFAGAFSKHAGAEHTGAVYAYDLIEKVQAAAIANFLGIGKLRNEQLANSQFQFAANAERPLAKMWLAIFHVRGECGFPKDESAAKTYAAQALVETKRLAASGTVEAQYLMAEAILSGTGEIRDDARAIDLMKSAAREEYLPAVRGLSMMYLQGEILKRDDLEALDWLAIAAEKNAKGITAEAVSWLESTVTKGDLSRCATLGLIYAEGLLVEKNTAKAYEYCQRGALANYPEAMDGLGSFYHAGIHVEKDLEKAAEWYRQAAAKGYAASMLHLGRLYHEKSNYREAASWLEKGALAGDLESMLALGTYYAHGTNGAPNSEKAIHWYRKAADSGAVEGMMCLGLLYLEDLPGTRSNRAQGFEWLSKAAANGFGPAETRLGKMYYNGEYVQQDFNKAHKHFERAVELNDLEGYVMQAKMYYFGKGVEKNEAAASIALEAAIKDGYDKPTAVITYYVLRKMQQTAAYGNTDLIGSALGAAWDIVTGNVERGIAKGVRAKSKNEASKTTPRSQLRHLRLQKQQLAGIDITQNPAAGLSSLRGAAAQKNPVALNNLGVIYWNGEVVEPNMFEAVELFVRAVDLGNREAAANLGLLYFDVGKYSNAVEFLSEAAKDKHEEAMNLLGQCYLDGLGAEKDYQQAMAWFSEAAKLGNAEAMKNLGYMFVIGAGVEKSYDEALRWLKGAADRGNAKAMYNLGIMHYKGTGVHKDYRTAAYWVKKAAALGDEDAEELLYCDACGNTGRMSCDECGGDGWVTTYDPDGFPREGYCRDCSGTGKVQCNVIHLADY